MSLKFISVDSEPTYIALSTDISGSKIEHATNIGKTVFTTDDNKWYIIKEDLTLQDYLIRNSNEYTDTNGISHGYINNNGSPQICSKPMLQSIAEGDVSGHSPFTKIGYCPASATNEYTVWNVATDYVFPTSASRMQVVSTNTEDSATGSGIRTIKIYYLKDDFSESTEIISLDGTNAVITSSSSIYRVNAFRAQTTGSSGAALGTISIKDISGSPIYDQIAVGYNASRSLIYTVPKNKLIYITNIFLSAGANSGGKRVTFTTKACYDTFTGSCTIGHFFMPFTETVLIDQAVSIDLNMPTKFIEGVDLKIVVKGEAGAVCTAQIRGQIENV